MTAADMYKAAVDARRARLYGRIKSCALAGDFKTRIYRDSITHIDDILDELVHAGFCVSYPDPEYIDISWEHIGTAFNQ